MSLFGPSGQQTASSAELAPQAGEGASPRAGRLACFCPPGVPIEGALAPPPGAWRPGVLFLAGGFSLSVLSQSLALGVLPLAGLLLAPKTALIVAPYIAMMLGAAAATFPASFLLDAFGRRAALALGASHGAAGGLVMAWALSKSAFWPFCLGAFWLGVAQGFSLFYRHEATVGADGAGRANAAAIVLGSGALAGFVGPALVWAVGAIAPDSVMAGSALAAALAQVAVLVLAIFAMERAPALSYASAARAPEKSAWREAVAPTLLAGLAWFAMTAVMLSAPFAMAGCGIGVSGVMGAIAWHVVAMYAPAFFSAPLSRLATPPTVVALGLALIVVAKWIEVAAGDIWGFSTALIVVAIGWSLTTSGATIWLHRQAHPSRAVLAAHDAVLFVSAIVGALAAVGPGFLGH